MPDFVQTVGRKVFERHIKQYEPKDPLYETYTDAKGKQKTRKRESPPGLSKRDVKVLRSVQKRAHHLDKGFHFCGMRFGWTFFIGIVPGVGDAANAVLNYVLVVRKAKQAEIPGWLLSRMMFNNAVSAGVGLVPIVGDIVVAVYKANSRNAALFEEYLRIRGEEFLKPEDERKQDARTIKPGAGRKSNEVIPPARGSSPKEVATEANKGSGGGWFRRGSKGSKKDKEKAAATMPESTEPLVPSVDRGRFIEDVPPNVSAETGKHKSR